MDNPRVFFDVSIGSSLKGRIVFELRADKVPKTAENVSSASAALALPRAPASPPRSMLTLPSSSSSSPPQLILLNYVW